MSSATLKNSHEEETSQEEEKKLREDEAVFISVQTESVGSVGFADPESDSPPSDSDLEDESDGGDYSATSEILNLEQWKKYLFSLKRLQDGYREFNCTSHFELSELEFKRFVMCYYRELQIVQQFSKRLIAWSYQMANYFTQLGLPEFDSELVESSESEVSGQTLSDDSEDSSDPEDEGTIKGYWTGREVRGGAGYHYPEIISRYKRILSQYKKDNDKDQYLRSLTSLYLNTLCISMALLQTETSSTSTSKIRGRLYGVKRQLKNVSKSVVSGGKTVLEDIGASLIQVRVLNSSWKLVIYSCKWTGKTVCVLMKRVVSPLIGLLLISLLLSSGPTQTGFILSNDEPYLEFIHNVEVCRKLPFDNLNTLNSIQIINNENEIRIGENVQDAALPTVEQAKPKRYFSERRTTPKKSRVVNYSSFIKQFDKQNELEFGGKTDEGGKTPPARIDIKTK
jgi:hypothetical protein